MKQSYSIRKSKALHQHWTNKHGTMVPKMQFKTLDDCLEYMDKHHINKDKYHPYICPDCGLWHIGHSKHYLGESLKEKERERRYQKKD